MKITTALFNKMYRIEIRAVAAICEVYLVFSVVCCQVSVSAYNVQSYLAVLHEASGGLHLLLTPDFRICHLRRSALVWVMTVHMPQFQRLFSHIAASHLPAVER